ncbi:GMC family oxidoreductase [Pacificispira sp.]|uniref:GMC family oxidoreductase n=1 Tax=Pacificispira sp. TaxID=2888761 RepID=UPI003BAA64C7
MEADYIVVGAGSAGCVLAERLSSDRQSRVLVVEAGGDDTSFWISTPIGYGKLFFDRSVNWAYRTEADPGVNGQTAYWPRGKVLGGSSSINAMVCIRGRAEDYEDWVLATKSKEWGAVAMARAFRSIDDCAEGESEWRGQGGALPIRSMARDAHALSRRFIQACAKIGIPPNPDFNGERQEGAGFYQINTRQGKRVSAATAFLRPAMQRPNVTVLKKALVQALLFEGPRCTGVVIDRDGREERYVARREVILAAGAIETPKLLQLSGIGDADQSRAFGIPVRVDNRHVGANLQDHFGLNYFYRSRLPTLNQELSPWHRRIWSGIRYLATRGGPLAMSVNQAGAFFRSSAQRPLPNMQLYLQLITTLEAQSDQRPLLAPDPYPAFALGLSNVRPKSRGRIMLAGADPRAAPKIYPNTYSDDADMEEMLEAVKLLRRLADTAPLSEIVEREVLPGSSVRSDSELVADIRARSRTVFHPCGTCAMGADPDSSVLTPDLRVRGVDGLRVADASAFPNIVSGNLNLPVMMFAVRAADIILSDRNKGRA